MCGTARASTVSEHLTLCAHCSKALLPLTDAEQTRLLAHVQNHPPLTAVPKRGNTTTSSIVTETTLTDRRVPDVTTVLVFKKLGWSTQEIADYFVISKSQAEVLVQASKRQTIAEAARDFVHTQLMPKVLSSLDKALDQDEGGKLALQIADRVGILQTPPQAEEQDSGTFEEYRMTVLRRRTNVSKPSQPETLDAETVVSVSDLSPKSLQAASPQRSRQSRAWNDPFDNPEGETGFGAGDSQPVDDGEINGDD